MFQRKLLTDHAKIDEEIISIMINNNTRLYLEWTVLFG